MSQLVEDAIVGLAGIMDTRHKVFLPTVLLTVDAMLLLHFNKFFCHDCASPV